MKLHLSLLFTAGCCAFSINAAAAVHDWTVTRVGSFNADALSATDFNNAGQLVVSWRQGSTEHGLLYTPGSGLFDLGSFGGSITRPTALNAFGEVAGMSTTATGAQQAFVYRNGNLQHLGLTGETSGSAIDINDRGQVLTSHNQSQATAIFDASGTPTRLTPVDGTLTPFGLNNRGQAYGIWSRPDDSPPSRTFFYDNGQVIDVGAGSFSFPQDMNESGQVLGNYRWSPFLYSNGQLSGIFAGERYITHGEDINNRGQVLGYTVDVPRGPITPFLFDEGQVRELTVLGDASPQQLNELGQVIGFSNLGGGVSHAFFYSDDDGRVTDLTQWLMASFDDIASVGTEGTSILLNDLGQIVLPGTLDNGERTLFVLTPVPEPATFVLMLAGAGVLSGVARRRAALPGVKGGGRLSPC